MWRSTAPSWYKQRLLHVLVFALISPSFPVESTAETGNGTHKNDSVPVGGSEAAICTMTSIAELKPVTPVMFFLPLKMPIFCETICEIYAGCRAYSYSQDTCKLYTKTPTSKMNDSSFTLVQRKTAECDFEAPAVGATGKFPTFELDLSIQSCLTICLAMKTCEAMSDEGASCNFYSDGSQLERDAHYEYYRKTCTEEKMQEGCAMEEANGKKPTSPPVLSVALKQPTFCRTLCLNGVECKAYSYSASFCYLYLEKPVQRVQSVAFTYVEKLSSGTSSSQSDCEFAYQAHPSRAKNTKELALDVSQETCIVLCLVFKNCKALSIEERSVCHFYTAPFTKTSGPGIEFYYPVCPAGSVPKYNLTFAHCIDTSAPSPSSSASDLQPAQLLVAWICLTLTMILLLERLR